MAQLYADLEDFPLSSFEAVEIEGLKVKIDYRFLCAIERIKSWIPTFGEVVATIEEYLEKNRD